MLETEFNQIISHMSISLQNQVSAMRQRDKALWENRAKSSWKKWQFNRNKSRCWPRRNKLPAIGNSMYKSPVEVKSPLAEKHLWANWKNGTTSWDPLILLDNCHNLMILLEQDTLLSTSRKRVYSTLHCPECQYTTTCCPVSQWLVTFDHWAHKTWLV